jgi:outer membrane usher protein FimD/PapC
MTTTTLQNAEEQFTKTVGQNGQVSIEAEHAGERVRVVWEVVRE